MKKIILAILPCLLLTCAKENMSYDVISNVKIEVIRYKSDDYILSIQTTLINNSNDDLYFFEPNLMVYDGVKSQSAYSMNLSDYKTNELLDSLLYLNRKSDMTNIGTRLRKSVKRFFQINNEPIYGSFVEKCIFLKKKESKILKEHLYIMKDKKLNGTYRFYLSNVSEKENKKGYEIYKNLPENFEGYKFWKGKIKSDTLDFLIRDFNLPDTQIKFNSPPTL